MTPPMETTLRTADFAQLGALGGGWPVLELASKVLLATKRLRELALVCAIGPRDAPRGDQDPIA